MPAFLDVTLDLRRFLSCDAAHDDEDWSGTLAARWQGYCWGVGPKVFPAWATVDRMKTVSTLRLAAQVWGIEHTSLIHSYLCMATTPIFIAGGTWIMRRPISRTELAGTALGAVGTVLLTLGPAAKGSQVRGVHLHPLQRFCLSC